MSFYLDGMWSVMSLDMLCRIKDPDGTADHLFTSQTLLQLAVCSAMKEV